MTLFDYASALSRRANRVLESGSLFAKVLTSNDDSGRHGVLIPSDAYSYFPYLEIIDPSHNATKEFPAFDCSRGAEAMLAYKYYERYPERRITRLPGILNDASRGPRLLVFLHARHRDGSVAYFFDCAAGDRFKELFRLVFGEEVQPAAGNFVLRPVDAPAFAIDPVLEDLLVKFDKIKARGWIDTLRAGDTGVGYTFETLLGIKENNNQTADFNGIEIKCKGVREGKAADSGKVNLFQAGPVWCERLSTRQRIRSLGTPGADGLYKCRSQVTTRANNLGLLLNISSLESKIDLRKNENRIGYWPFKRLEKRLAEKHSRAVFVKARTRVGGEATQYAYEELVYCDRPSIDRFLNLVSDRNIVFEFIMAEEADGRARNHGYPWRLIRADFLGSLFTFQIKLR